MKKRLTRSRTNRKITGVCGGLGEYFGIDPSGIRLAFLVAFLIFGSGFFVYLVLTLIMPEEPLHSHSQQHQTSSKWQRRESKDDEWSDF